MLRFHDLQLFPVIFTLKMKITGVYVFHGVYAAGVGRQNGDSVFVLRHVSFVMVRRNTEFFYSFVFRLLCRLLWNDIIMATIF